MEKIFENIKTHFQNLRQRSRFSFSDLKTSTQIGLKFTLFTILQVLVFSLLANAIFFQSWNKKQQDILSIQEEILSSVTTSHTPMMRQRIVLGKNRVPEVEIFRINSIEGNLLLQNNRWRNISHIDDMYFMYRLVNNDILITNITPHIVVQKNLIRISMYLTLFFGAIAYILSLFFVKNSLKKLHTLLGFLNHVHIDKKNWNIRKNPKRMAGFFCIIPYGRHSRHLIRFSGLIGNPVH